MRRMYYRIIDLSTYGWHENESNMVCNNHEQSKCILILLFAKTANKVLYLNLVNNIKTIDTVHNRHGFRV